VVVIGVPNEKWGEVPNALIVLKPGKYVTEEEIISHARKYLAGYKAPKSVEFRSEFPKGGTGKILKLDLKKEYWADLDKNVQ
jgi:long-chain acyl-CoA synthetase